MHKRYRRPQNHFVPLSTIQAEAIVDDRDYIAKVYGAAPAIVFQFTHMENMASIRTLVDEKRAALDISMDVEMNGSYRRTKSRSAKQIAAGKKWSARKNDDGDKIHGYDDGEWEPQSRCAGYYADV